FVEAVPVVPAQLLGNAFKEYPAKARDALMAARKILATVEPFEAAAVEAALRALAGTLGIKGGDLFTLLRESVAAKPVTPPLFESISVLGRERTEARLDKAFQALAATV